jgi:hypothetical protein
MKFSIQIFLIIGLHGGQINVTADENTAMDAGTLLRQKFAKTGQFRGTARKIGL